MFQRFSHRRATYPILILVWGLLFLPNLGVPSLWEVDEGHNSAASNTMLESGNYVVPTFNGELRDDKPALLNWLQAASFQLLGVNEWAARLPSALAALAALLLLYELGRRMFNPAVGLLAAVILSTSISFCVAAHFANPDALLTLFLLATLSCFWKDFTAPGRLQFVGGGIAIGLAVLAKGPVGVVLPLSIIALFLIWQRRLGYLFSPRQWRGVLAFLVTSAPWYVWVTVETKGQWLARFWTKHNQGRFFGAMENHGGPPYYYLGILIIGLGFWSIFLGMTAFHAARREPEESGPIPNHQPWPWPWLTPQVRLLICWFLVVFGLFTLSATKLPNYILPLYPAAALLIARSLIAWERGVLQPRWWHPISASLLILGVVGLVIVVVIGMVSGLGPINLMKERTMPALGGCMVLGLIPLGGALLSSWYWNQSRRDGVIFSVALTSVLFVATAAAWAPAVITEYRAPRTLAGLLPGDQLCRDVRIAAYHYFQPSLVFYCQRRVDRLETLESLERFLLGPLPSYLFVLESDWETAPEALKQETRIVGRHCDLYYRCPIIVLANRAAW